MNPVRFNRSTSEQMRERWRVFSVEALRDEQLAVNLDLVSDHRAGLVANRLDLGDRKTPVT
jgi:hypothetical protein